VAEGTIMPVSRGTVNADTEFRITNTGAITIGTTSLTFESRGASDSSNQTFLQAGTGAVSRTTQAKLRDRVSVTDFGATGDGITNDTAAMQAAIDAVDAAGGGMVYFPEGTYLKSAAIDLPENVYLQGDSLFTTIIKNNAADIDGIALPTTESKNSGISGLTIFGNASDTNNTGIAFDSAVAFGNLVVENTRIAYFQYGIDLFDTGWNSTFRNVRIDFSVTNGVRGVGSSGGGLGNLFEAVYVNAVGGSGTSFYFSNSLTRGVFNGCIVGATTSKESQFRLDNVRGCTVNTLNLENIEIDAADGLIRIGSDSTVVLNAPVFQSITGPVAGNGHLIRTEGNAVVTVTGAFEYTDTANNIKTLRAEGSSIINHSGNNWFSAIDYTSLSGSSQINLMEGVQYRQSIEIDLSGAATTVFLANIPNRYGFLRSANIIYTEATSSDAGILIEVGYVGDTNYLASLTTSISQSLWDVDAMTIHNADIGSWAGPIIITSPGGKTGTGNIIIEIEYTATD
jgi:hypothetical protein